MTDRELLEAAAKAADFDAVISMYGWDELTGSACLDGNEPPELWNPLTDDGDALRLAVTIGEPFVVRTRCVTTMGGLKEDFDPDIAGDDLRATRRAIVRAAAALAGEQT